MITIHMTADDLAKMRFAYSPLLELSFSYRILNNPLLHGRYRRWVEEAKGSLHGLDFTYLHALATIPHYVPDFMTPTPTGPVFDIEDEFRRMRNVSNEQIRKNILYVIQIQGETALLRDFLTYPRELLECLIEDLRLYWARVLAVHWPRMVDVVEGDVLYRARQLALEGAETLFGGLDEEMRFHDYRLEYIASGKPHWHQREYQLAGSGLYLVPTIFEKSIAWQIEPEWQPMIIYQPRGTGLWWSNPRTEPDQSLEIALGTGRAQVLRQLETPSSTGEIARRLEITSGAASQHLSRLNEAGLVEPHRSGKRVYYHLTRRGQQLLALFM